MSRDIDPITFEVLRNAMDSIADQMAIILMRSAYSGLVRESLDYSTGFCDAAGRLIAQGLTTPLHLGSFPAAMQHLIQTHGGQMHAGDVFALNDPYLSGGTHLPDLYVIKPVFHAETVEGFAATLAHHTDMGGITPGSNPVHSTEIYQEGLRIPLLKAIRPRSTEPGVVRPHRAERPRPDQGPRGHPRPGRGVPRRGDRVRRAARQIRRPHAHPLLRRDDPISRNG